MRFLAAAALVAVLGCASASALRQLRAEQVATCQRFEEYQLAREGRLTHPCHPQEAHATLTPQSMGATAN